jgi:cell pole-organizing protein PopZ
MNKKSEKIVSNKSAAAIKAELSKYSEIFNVKETQKIVEEVVKKVTESLLKDWINANIDKVVKQSIKEELKNIAKKKI